MLDIFTFVLSRYPCRSGIRLRSEPELARILNVNRQRVRRSLDHLVESGYLTRKHGSGTFVRKVFPPELASSEDVFRGYTDIIPEQFFINEQPARSHTPEKKAQRLQIGVSGDSALLTQSNQLIFNGAVSHLKTLDCRPVIYSHLTYDTTEIKPTDELAEELKKNRCDGYLIESSRAEQFNEAFSLAFGRDNCPPVSYFWPGSTTLRHEPLIQQDTHEAVCRAVKILAASGYVRIALVALEHPQPSEEKEEDTYNLALVRAGIQYRGVISCTNFKGSGLLDNWSRLWNENRPDALYIADDHFLPLLSRWMKEKRIIPGKDIGVITLWNKGGKFPDETQWSRLEFDPHLVGMMAANNLVRSIQMTGELTGSFSHQAAWIPGSTHL